MPDWKTRPWTPPPKLRDGVLWVLSRFAGRAVPSWYIKKKLSEFKMHEILEVLAILRKEGRVIYSSSSKYLFSSCWILKE